MRKVKNFEDWMKETNDTFVSSNTLDYTYSKVERVSETKKDFAKVFKALTECENIFNDLALVDEAIDSKDYVFAISQIYRTKFHKLKTELLKLK